MKRISSLLLKYSPVIVVLMLSFLLLTTFCASAQEKSWDFERFDVDIFIQSDGSFLVKETQTVNFRGNFSFFYRSIALNRLDRIRDINVTDLAGKPVPADLYIEDNKQFIKLNFDITDQTKTWIFEYMVDGGIGFFADHDELYWNAISSERDVPIKSSKVRVVLPADATMIDMRSRLFYGPEGSTNTLSTHKILDNKTFEFEAHDIMPNTHLTIVAGWPKGIVDEPFVKSRTWKLISAGLGLIIFLVISGIILVLFLRYGRDPEGRHTIIPQYEPPNDVGPLQLAMLVKEGVGAKDISAAVVDMARRGYLRMIETTEKKVFKDKKTLTFERLKDPVDLAESELTIYDGIFEHGGRVELSMMEDKFYKHIPKIKSAAMDEVKKLGYYNRNPLTIKVAYFAVGVILITLGIVGYFILPDFKYIPAGMGAGGLIVTVFANFMSRRTLEGVLAYEHALGFKDYLHTAERFRIAASTPEEFERFLPHAMTLGVEKQWAERFADIYKQQPDWYVGAGGQPFSSIALASSMNTMGTSMSSTFASSPSSSSGFGGGGGAGGGGGGGGSGAG